MTSKNKQIGSTSSHSSSPSLRWIYDIFVSFRGEDTRKNFTDHLYAALVQKDIIVFRDDCRLEKGKAIAPELLKAIEESRFSIVIFSSNYASSTWCLDELVKIVECMEVSGQTVFPIFYKVEPSEVRKQTGNFRTAFAKHEEVFRENIQKVRRWRAALTEVANLSGWDLQDRHESTFIQEIVEEISNKLNNRISCTDKHLVGIDSRMEELFQYLGTGMDDIRFIGICGMGGIGKTTLSQVVYDKISCEFEGSSFVANVRETSERCGLASLQEQLLSEVLRDRNIRIQNAHAGVNAIMTRCCHRKILLILDDVDQQEQLEKLAGNHDWFGSGSRIIITTRDEHLLASHGVDGIYQARGLNNDEALLLFSWKAFKKDHPTKDYEKLSSFVINYADGLPLALEILGSFLFDRKVHEWESALDRLKKVPNRKIMEVLKISYDGLEETEKEIFLDIACFFKSEFKVRLTRILNGCGFYADIGLSVLIEKSLINVSCNVVYMHDLIQEMGRDIVRQESPKEPGKRSRLWHSEDIYDVLLNKKGTEAVEGLVLVSGQKVVALDADAFSKLSKLRLLKISNVRLPQGLKYLSNELRYLKWHGYPLKSLPSGFQSEKLFKLNMWYSHVEQLWEGTKHLTS